MRIEVKRIRNVRNWLASIGEGAGFRVKHSGNGEYLRKRLGLATEAPSGTSILPSIVGRISRFNSEGKWIALKDLPKENRYVQTVRWSWTTYDGVEHTDFKDIFRLCYQRDFMSPPSVELEFRENAIQSFVFSPEFKNTEADAEKNAHVFNLLLELFGSCDVVQADLATIPSPILKKANWRLLPSGAHPFDQIKAHVEHAVRHMSEATCSVILDRQKTLEEFGPEEKWVGEGGFNDYVAYVFKSFGLVVLESLRRDNAIYVFADNWQAVSKLTKAEILQGGLHHSRIVHVDGWKSKLAQLFVKKAA
jgi:hypothetical protein